MQATRPTASPARGSGGFWTVAATYVAALVVGAAGGAIGLAIPCTGFLCSVGNLVMGAGFGVLASALIAAVVARRDGVWWWYTPIAYGVPIVALVGTGILLGGSRLGEGALLALGLAGPVIAVALAGRMRRRWRAVLLGLVAVAIVVVPLLQEQAWQSRRAGQQGAQVTAWRNAGHPVYAPVHRDQIQVTYLSVLAASDGSSFSALYDMTQAGVPGTARVSMETGPNADSRCGAVVQPDADGIVTFDGLGGVGTVCRRVDGGTVMLWQDGPDGNWHGDRLVQLARDLEPTDATWLEQHMAQR